MLRGAESSLLPESDSPRLAPKCNSEYVYESGTLLSCPDCAHDWTAGDVADSIEKDTVDPSVIKDSNGTVLQNGDSVIIIKNLPVKGAPKPIKAGTKVNNIRLTDGDHNIDCKIDGFGSMALKSEFVRKA